MKHKRRIRGNLAWLSARVGNSGSEKGIALLIVLWVLTILMVIVLSFSFAARTETLSTMSYKSGVEKKFLAEAAIERGIMELFYRSIYRGQTVELEGKEVWKADGAPHTEQFGEGYYTVRITDEAGKVDINTASEVVLKNLLTNGGIGEEEADIIVDSIMDWKDPDDLHRLHGAESDYYRSLPNPYDAKNAEFSTVEELIMVKGITPQLLYGSAGKKGLIEFLTVHAKKARINVKSAPKEVLLAVPGMTPEAADEIIALRSTKELTLADVVGILSGNAAEALRYIEADDSGVFTIDGTGGKTGEKGVYGIRATVSISEMNKYSYLYYKVPATIQE